MAKKLGKITKILRLATKLVKKGWTTGAGHRVNAEGFWRDRETSKQVEGGCYCITGALAKAAHEVCGGFTYYDEAYASDEDVVVAVGENLEETVLKIGFKGIRKNKRPLESIITWNDARATKAEVVACLERAAEAAREQGI